MEDFRRIFNLDEIRDPRTKRVITPAIYTSFREVRQYILEATQMELYELYMANHSNLWFDYLPGTKKGRGGKVSSVFGWSLEPIPQIRRTKKTMEPDMFDM